MEIEKNNASGSRREKSLKGFFFHFLVRTLLYMILMCGIWGGLFYLGIATGQIIPADEIERSVNDWESQVKDQGVFDLETFPQEAGYILQKKDGTCQTFHLSKEAVDVAKTLTEGEQTQYYSLTTQMNYKKIRLGSEVVVAGYQMKAVFRNQLLARLFPDIEILLFIMLILLLVLAVVTSILQTAGKMQRDIAKMQETVVEIQRKNLDFDVTYTSLREFNSVLQVLDELKMDFADSLQLQWKMEQDKRTQMSALAHDIKTPLTIISGNAELLAEGDLADEDREYAASICKKAVQIQDYVNQIISISKEQPMDTEHQTFSMLSLLEGIVQETAMLAHGKNVKLSVHVNGIEGVVSGELKQLRRVYLNVISNAVSYTPAGGVITLSAMTENVSGQKQVRCIISDTGPGFSNEALLHATEQFYQEDKSRTDDSHYGLGLYIAGEILKSYHGSLELANAKEGGARVTILLPVFEADS